MQFPPWNHRSHRTHLKLLLCSLLAWSTLQASQTARAESRLDVLVGQLESTDRFSRHRAEAEILKQGDALLPGLVDHLRQATPARARVLKPLFDELLGSFLDDYELDVSALRNTTVAFQRLTDIERTPRTNEEIAERRESLREQISELRESQQGQRELLDKLIPMALPTILRRSHFHVSPPDPFEEILRHSLEQLSDAEIALVSGSGSVSGAQSEVRRYELGPFWNWIVERSAFWERLLKASREAKKSDPSTENDETAEGPTEESAKASPTDEDVPAEALKLIERARDLSTVVTPLLEDHMKRSFADLLSGDFRRRELAEDTFFLLGKRAVSFLEKNKASDSGQHSEYVLGLLRWRVHPRVRERTGMDFRDYGLLGFRERRRFIIDYARTAGNDAVPTLRAIVNEDGLEPLNRVKLTAAEALAGMGDLRAIQELNNRRIPELMKIPEISREFFLLQGLKFQEDKKYELAIQEFQKILDESPFHFQANYHIAFVYLLAKNYKKSIHHFVIARRIRPEDTLTLYNLACAYSLDGQIDNALESLEASIKAGFHDHSHISKDPDLDPLRQEDKFREMLKKLRSA